MSEMNITRGWILETNTQGTWKVIDIQTKGWDFVLVTDRISGGPPKTASVSGKALKALIDDGSHTIRPGREPRLSDQLYREAETLKKDARSHRKAFGKQLTAVADTVNAIEKADLMECGYGEHDVKDCLLDLLDAPPRGAEAMSLLLFCLDSEISVDTRFECSSDLDQLLADRDIERFVEKLALSAPLPKEADLDAICRAREAGHRRVENLILRMVAVK